tara:strand:+ start:24 stop:503 length:480 start_codon:yes stop_codon:yes gene_type:complete
MTQKYKVYINNNTQIVTDNLEDNYHDHIIVQAAGGVVYNLKNQLLMIYRNGKWDLPKGKLELNEDIKKCAIREVEEECGVKNLVIINKIKDTYHTYSIKDKKILKKTTWFIMKTDFIGKLSPQINEGITNVVWLNSNQVEQKLKNTYGNIIDVLNESII